MTDNEIIEQIRLGKLEDPIRYLYLQFPKIRSLLLKDGAKEDWTHEIFNDSLILLIEKVKNPEFQLTAKLTTYLTGISRFMLKNYARKENKLASLHPGIEHENFSDLEEGYDFEKEEKFKLMEQILLKLNAKCQQILHFFYFDKLSMTTIAQKLGFSSEKSAKTQKYKCLEKAHSEANRLFIHLDNQPS